MIREKGPSQLERGTPRMMQRATTHLATLALGVALGVGAVAVAADPEPKAQTAANIGDVVRELRTTNRKLDLVNRNLGGYALIAPSGGSVQRLLRSICRELNGSNC
jgi:hypothetical protein